jgi:hypothetical protein
MLQDPGHGLRYTVHPTAWILVELQVISPPEYSNPSLRSEVGLVLLEYSGHRLMPGSESHDMAMRLRSPHRPVF